jgi:carboxymethylenebutenolidase
MGNIVEFKRPDGKTSKGYLTEGNKDQPAIVVIQEWWGMNDQIKKVADTLKDAGYRALVPDLYKGKLALDANEAKHLMTGLNFLDAATQDIRGAVQYLKSTGSKKVAVTGFCMGGALTCLSSVHVPELDCGVIWYGYPPLELVDASKIKIPLMGHWAIHDDSFKLEGVDQLEKKLKDAKVNFEFFRYDAKHAFANEEADEKHLPYLKYNAEAKKLAWSRTISFLKKNLS